jgi:hypothetical protein
MIKVNQLTINLNIGQSKPSPLASMFEKVLPIIMDFIVSNKPPQDSNLNPFGNPLDEFEDKPTESKE